MENIAGTSKGAKVIEVTETESTTKPSFLTKVLQSKPVQAVKNFFTKGLSIDTSTEAQKSRIRKTEIILTVLLGLTILSSIAAIITSIAMVLPFGTICLTALGCVFMFAGYYAVYVLVSMSADNARRTIEIQEKLDNSNKG